MQSLIFALVAFGLLLTLVQCKRKSPFTIYEIKQDFLREGRSYTITGQTKSASNFSIRNESSSSIGEKLTLLENGKERYTVKHDIDKSSSTWTISDLELRSIWYKIRYDGKFDGSKLHAVGQADIYDIEGHFDGHEFTISHAHHEVAKIHKKQSHSDDTYSVLLYPRADKPLMVLFAIIVDEILEH